MPHATTATVKGQTLPLYPLETIKYASILAKDEAEVARMRKAAVYPGFFYLDFNHDEPSGESKQIAADLKEIWATADAWFEKNGPENKMNKMEIRHDHLPNPKLPEGMQSSLPTITRLSNNMRAANVAMVSNLYPSVLETNHRVDQPSETALDIMYAPTEYLAKDTPDTTHLDGGTFTILCSEAWGLKLEDPRTKEWTWVEPKEGCGIANVANWLDAQSKKIDGGEGVHSCRHAVSQIGDGLVRRVYITHFLRPGQNN